MDIAGYLNEITTLYNGGQTTEHSFRPALAKLFNAIDDKLTVINEPKKTDAGMPDFLFQRGDVPVGWCEAKDIDKDVIALKGYSIEQRKRYEKAFPNLIYTNGVDFEFIREGEQVHFVSIADFVMGLQPKPEKFDELERQLQNFAAEQPVTIRSAQKLAELMAAKAAIIKDEIGIALGDDPQLRSNLAGQFKSFKADLLPNLTTGEFSDIYAETITYGMFAARLHDESLDTFSRQEALELLPKSNPFLRDLFGYIAGPALPDRLRYIVDDLAAVLRASDPFSLFEDFGKWTARNDPFIHFYEDFLKEYNPKKKKSRGVWYTPEPVVDFIVRAVDDVLKSEFGLKDGLADTSKVTVDWDTGENDKKGKPVTIKKDVHKVQILDPATGTGTFLAKTIQTISDRVKARAPGKWSGYVEGELIPRIHGFELLMASYAMCHMKLDMMLRETGYTPSDKPPRLSVWLTNALEEGEREVRDLFFAPLATEARGANDVKRQAPIMCIIGNPPYSAQSQNRGKWISELVSSYKRNLKEKKINLDDDYIKFIRRSQEFIAANGSGVIGMISNNSFLDGVTHRAMRLNLLEVFDEIRILDLHGSSMKREESPDGSADKNVFDIKQGVSIALFIKKEQCQEGLAKLLHADLYGSRQSKNEALWNLKSVSDEFTPLNPKEPYFFFSPKDFSNLDIYDEGFQVTELFGEYGSGVKTERDRVSVHFEKSSIEQAVADFIEGNEDELRVKYNLKKDSRDWTVPGAVKDVREHSGEDLFTKVTYRPFDFRHTYYTGKTRGFMGTPGRKIGREFMLGNLGLILSRTVYGAAPWQDVQVTDSIVEFGIMATRVGNTAPAFPLYLYPDNEAEQGDAFSPTGRTVNFDPKIYAAICKAAGLSISSLPQSGGEGDRAKRGGGAPPSAADATATSPSLRDREDDAFRTATGDDRPTEVKVFDYIYGVLHSPEYRETYKEFLKIDFPRIPYPKSPEVFAHVSEKGEALRRIHLMEDAAIGVTDTPFMGEGDDIVVKPAFDGGKVHINKEQYFSGVPALAWEFHVGGYQPAQKWLKDRKGRSLSYDDIIHYQKIIKILCETDRIMKEIELPLD